MAGKTVQCSNCKVAFLVEPVQTPPSAAAQPIPDKPILATHSNTESVGASHAAGPYEWSPALSLRIIVRAVQQWLNNADATFGAAMAFYAVFAIVPMLFLIIVAWGYIRGDDKKNTEVLKSAERFLGKKLGEKAAEKLNELTDDIKKWVKDEFTEHQFWPLLVTIGIHISSVLALFVQTRAGVSVVWKIQPANSFALICFDYLLALTLVGLTALSLFVSLIFDTMPEGTILPEAEVISFSILTLALAVIFKVLSANRTITGNVSYRISWGYALFGSLITSMLFLLGKNLLQRYLIDYILQSELYWRGGLLLVFMLWVYYCSLVFFFGAELIQACMTRNEWLNRMPKSE